MLAIGTILERKRDGAIARIVDRGFAVPSQAHPGPYGKTIYTVRLANEEERSKVGGDQSGSISWIRTYFKVQ